jgi:hypothetical protein
LGFPARGVSQNGDIVAMDCHVRRHRSIPGSAGGRDDFSQSGRHGFQEMRHGNGFRYGDQQCRLRVGQDASTLPDVLLSLKQPGWQVDRNRDATSQQDAEIGVEIGG